MDKRIKDVERLTSFARVYGFTVKDTFNSCDASGYSSHKVEDVRLYSPSGRLCATTIDGAIEYLHKYGPSGY